MVTRHDERTESTALPQPADGDRAVVLVFWEDKQTSFALPARGTLTIGRATDCEIRVDHASVSRKHARLHVENGAVSVEDLGSSNGTRLAGRRLAPNRREPMPRGQLLEIGLASLVVYGGDASSAPVTTSQPQSDLASMPSSEWAPLPRVAEPSGRRAALAPLMPPSA